MQFAVAPITVGWVLAFLVLILAVIFVVIGLPDPRALLGLVALLAAARLL
jgi:hypothetical protein